MANCRQIDSGVTLTSPKRTALKSGIALGHIQESFPAAAFSLADSQITKKGLKPFRA